MNAHFSKWGNSLALRIPNSIAKELKVFEGKLADIQVRDGALVVTPVDVAPSYDINALVALIKPENLHGEIDTGGAVGNEIG
ncbi:MAG: AbrB/MazE/SpoVT family DNA-binding domain-containing protein [Xanthobacteraceae bacterium]|nr:AbrB/MazE/SpoVT family DNA-binding domain-containing protein [Xanthobacteraceae bacterium]